MPHASNPMGLSPIPQGALALTLDYLLSSHDRLIVQGITWQLLLSLEALPHEGASALD